MGGAPLDLSILWKAGGDKQLRNDNGGRPTVKEAPAWVNLPGRRRRQYHPPGGWLPYSVAPLAQDPPWSRPSGLPAGAAQAQGLPGGKGREDQGLPQIRIDPVLHG